LFGEKEHHKKESTGEHSKEGYGDTEDIGGLRVLGDIAIEPGVYITKGTT
jgi:hypothetical protein